MRRRLPLRVMLPALLLGLLVAWVLWPDGDESGLTEIQFSEFSVLLDEGQLTDVQVIEGLDVIRGITVDKLRFETKFLGANGDEIVDRLLGAEPEVNLTLLKSSTPWWIDLLFMMLPFLFMAVIFVFVIRMFRSGNQGFSKTKARKLTKDLPKTTFHDVAGSDEAVEELLEIKEFLTDPVRFYAMGAKIPKGVLLYGPPGTGKTLLARAVAGEAGVPFFSISGSDFVEMFVGVGASRVRDLFAQAKEEAPAIIFIDEIDAVGRHRGAGLGGGHDEREQTLNQLLVEMDGFDATAGVILIAATNRPDILDPALLRPGRFDRQIAVDRPDVLGREHILSVHMKGKPLARDVDPKTVARRTPGFTGADLANLMNEAALLAARKRTHEIDMSLVEDAIDRVLAGPQRKSRVLSEHEREIIAYHEAGHALVGHVLKHTDPIHKVSIIARGRALGWTLALPEHDKYLRSRAQLEDELAMLLGGRTAEEMIFGDPTTGASDDIERVSNLARAMVTQYGMSDRLGPQQLGKAKGEVFLGKNMTHEANYSDGIAKVIDDEVERIITVAHDSARSVLTTHLEVLDRLAKELLERETLDRDDLAEVFAGIGKWDPHTTELDLTAPLHNGYGGRSAGVAPVGVGELRASVEQPLRDPKRRANELPTDEPEQRHHR